MYNSIVSFIHSLYDTDEFVPLHSPLFIGNERGILVNVLIQHSLVV